MSTDQLGDTPSFATTNKRRGLSKQNDLDMASGNSLHSTAHKVHQEYATHGNNSGGEDISIVDRENELHSREYLSVNQTGISAN